MAGTIPVTEFPRTVKAGRGRLFIPPTDGRRLDLVANVPCPECKKLLVNRRKAIAHLRRCHSALGRLEMEARRRAVDSLAWKSIAEEAET